MNEARQYRQEEVSEDLQKVLNVISGEIPESKEEEVKVF